MWWERFGLAPVRPEQVDGHWHSVDLTLKSFNHMDKALKAARPAGAVGWWLGPWQPTSKGYQAVITLYFSKRTQARRFEANPPVSQRR